MATNQMRREAAKRKLERQQERRVQQARRRRQTVVMTSVAVVVLVLVGVVVLTNLPSGTDPAADPAASPSDAAAAAAPGDCAFTPSEEPAAREAPIPPSGPVETTGTQAVTLDTSGGPIPLTLDRATGPCAVTSFLNLAGAAYFDGTPCHRLTTGAGLQVLQCGDPTGQGTGGPGYTINDEPPTTLADAGGGSVVYPRGTLAMAKTSLPDSAGSQFFLVYGDSTLPPDYAVFGTVGEAGLATLDAIAAGGSNESNGPGDGGPNTPVTINSVTVG